MINLTQPPPPKKKEKTAVRFFFCCFTKVKILWSPKMFDFPNFLCCYMCDSYLFSFISLLPLVAVYVTSVSLRAWHTSLLRQVPLDDSIAAEHFALFVFVHFR